MDTMRLPLSAALAATILAACGGGDPTNTGGGGTGTTTGGGAGGAVPEHPALPQVISIGGPVLAHPKVQPIVYASDPQTGEIEAFLAELASTSYWGQATAEYGVGALTVLPTLKIADPAPASLSDGDLQTALEDNTGGVNPAWGTPDASVIYLFVLPKGTVVDAGGPCCTEFDGYHDEVTLGSTTVAYASVCSCPGFDGKGVDEIQQITVAMSHELIEAATDPFVQSNPAYYQTDDDNPAWTLATGGEVADMCELDDGSFVIPQGSKYMVQKSWSNAAAAAGAWPCVPATSAGPYFAATPVLSDEISISGWSGSHRGGIVPSGQSRTFDVKLWAAGPLAGPIEVKAVDLADFFGGKPHLDLSFDKPSGQSGDTLHLTVKVNGVDSTLGADVFVVEAKVGSDVTLSLGAINTH
jgi:hypothetical protein